MIGSSMGIGYLIIGASVAILSTLVSSRLKSKFKKYSALHLKNGLSGKEIAEKMLNDYGITDVSVISVKGQLTDHYNPIKKTVNLSEVVYNKRNASAAAVAAHEVGHAVQHAFAYRWLTLRSKMVPIASIANRVIQIVLWAGVIMGALFRHPIFLLIAAILFGVTALLSVITLPVEYDASKRALAWLKDYHMVTEEEYSGAKDALKWAARTYLVAALGAIATFVYFLMRYLAASNRNR